MARSSRMRGTPSASDLAVYVKYRDSSCRVSDYQDGLRAAHLCPKNATAWFEANRMGKYCKSQGLYGNYVTDDIANAIALRANLHDVFDDQKVAIAPKNGVWKALFFGLTFTLGSMYHNEPLKELSKEISPSFILARLAWTIFPLTHEFNEGGPRRRVKVLIEEDNTWREEIFSKVIQKLDLSMRNHARAVLQSGRPRRLGTMRVVGLERDPAAAYMISMCKINRVNLLLLRILYLSPLLLRSAKAPAQTPISPYRSRIVARCRRTTESLRTMNMRTSSLTIRRCP